MDPPPGILSMKDSAMVTAFVIVVIVVVSVGTAWLGRLCLQSISDAAPPIEQVFKRHRSSLLELPGVHFVAIGETHGVPCVVVYARELSEHESSRIPASLEGWEVRRQTVHYGRGPAHGRVAAPPGRGGRLSARPW